MILLLALLIPFAIGFAAYFIAGKKITPKELAVQLGAVALLVIVTYLIMLSGRTGDVELINSSIAERSTGHEGCCHSYPCNCHESCSGSGSSRSCTTECDTCYEHSHDIYWEASTTTGNRVYYDGCNPPGTEMPSRWGHIYVGEPAVERHGFTNYIKGNPNSILRREAVSPALLAQVPEYPRVFDYYRTLRVLNLGANGVDIQALNHELDYVNSQLGPKRQVNIILIITKESDLTFGEAVRQKWLGGKKNDVIVIVGAPAFPEVAWVDVLSWTQEEAMKIRIRDNILAMHTFNGHNALGIIAYEVDQGFKRRHMKDFEYLSAGIEPSSTETTWLFIVAAGLSIGLSGLFARIDLFNEERPRRFNRYL
jgi:hypothetical protein